MGRTVEEEEWEAEQERTATLSGIEDQLSRIGDLLEQILAVLQGRIPDGG